MAPFAGEHQDRHHRQEDGQHESGNAEVARVGLIDGRWGEDRHQHHPSGRQDYESEEPAGSAGIDGPWSDILWRLRGDDDIVDDEFLRYFEFVTDICQWRAGQLPGGTRLETRALQLFGTAGPLAEASLDFLFHAFDTWAGADIANEFGRLFATNRADLAGHRDRLLLFGTETGAALFDACCRSYGSTRFTYGRTLLLFAVLLDRAAPSRTSRAG